MACTGFLLLLLLCAIGVDIWDGFASLLALGDRPNADVIRTTDEQKPLAMEAMKTLESLVDTYPAMLGWMKSGYAKDAKDLQMLMMFCGMKVTTLKVALAKGQTIEGEYQPDPDAPVGGWPNE